MVNWKGRISKELGLTDIYFASKLFATNTYNRDLDANNDGTIDFIFSSKDKHLYFFDENGYNGNYNTESYLIGTPAIGNIDDDDELEVIIGGYSIVI